MNMDIIQDGVGRMSIQNNGCTFWLSSIFYNVWVSLSVSMTDFPLRSWVGSNHFERRKYE